MIAQELRELPDDELRQKLADGKEELFNLRFQVVTGQLDNPRRLREVRRDIARVLTVMKEREIAAELRSAAGHDMDSGSDDAIGEELATVDSRTALATADTSEASTE